jgi:hypothetical protein
MVLTENVIIYCLILTLLYFTPGENGVDGKDGAPGEDGADGKDGAPGQPGHTTVVSILYCTMRRDHTSQFDVYFAP